MKTSEGMAGKIFNGKVKKNGFAGYFRFAGWSSSFASGCWSDLRQNSFKPFTPMPQWKTAQTGKGVF